MFIYSGSKLESDIAELNSNLLKTDYQKSIEPYQNEISELYKKILELKKENMALLGAVKMIIGSVEKDVLQIAVLEEEPKIYFGAKDDIPLEQSKISYISLNIKEELMHDLFETYQVIKNKYEIVGNKWKN